MKYILEKVNYQTLIMMLSDAPRYVRKKKTEPESSGAPVNPETAAKEAGDIVSFFQSKLEL